MTEARRPPLLVVAAPQLLAGSFHAAVLASCTLAGEPAPTKAEVAQRLGVDASNYARWTAGAATTASRVLAWMKCWPAPLCLLSRSDGASVVAPQAMLAQAVEAIHPSTVVDKLAG